MPAKKALNLSIDAELATEAKANGTNLSALLETTLRSHLSDVRAKQWLEENRVAIEASNKQLAEDGLWYTPDWLDQ